ncbi:MAG: hypothetical protein P4M02_02665 [Clostridia bacterium]|nr:hypothetical protein [Clostridia bacterium]
MTRRAAMVILNHNDTGNTVRLCRQMAGCDDIARIVVADNSGPAGRCAPEQLPAKAELLPVGNHGYARGNNDAIAHLEEIGGFDYLFISNPDVIVPDQAVAACLDFLDAHPQYALAAPHMLHSDGTPHHLTGWKEKDFVCDLAYCSGVLSRLIGIDREAYPCEYWRTDFSDVDCVSGSFFAARLAPFRQIGFFDPHTFLFYEEDIIGFKLKRLGHRADILNCVSFTHLEGASIGQSAGVVRRYCHMQKSRLYFQHRYKRVGAARYTLLCAATCLGFAEKLLKALYLKISGKQHGKKVF